MSDVVLRIQSSVAQGVAGVRAFKDEIRATEVATVDLRSTWKATTAEMVADARKQIAVEKEKVDAIRAQLAAQREVTASYVKGSEQRQLSTKMEIDLQRRLQVSLGETAAVASRARHASRTGAEESALLRGAASRSGIAGTGMAAFAGPGFIAGAVVGGTLDYAVKAALSEQKANANLTNALRNTGNARKETRKQTEEYIKAQERATGFDREQVTQTLSQLIRSTGDLTKARRDEALMADIARARQTDLSGAMMLVLKASMGNVGALRRLGIDVQKVTVNADALKAAHLSSNVALAKHAKELDLAATKTEVMRAVTAKFTGASAGYTKTFAGETDKLKNTVHDLFVELGTRAIPILSRLFGWMQKEIDAARHSKTVHQILHDAVAVLKTAWDGLTVIVRTVHDLMRNHLIRTLTLVAGAIWLVNAALDANPWMALATAAILAIGLIHKHWSGFKLFFEKLWRNIEAVFYWSWDQMKIGAVDAALAIIEPFSHLPGSMGKWARDMKDNLHHELVLMKRDAADQAALIGGTAGKAMLDAFMPYASAMASLTPGSTGATGGNPAARAQAGGTQFGLITKAKQLGVGSGGIYVKGGGHGGIAKPGTAMDCSGYVYQVFTQNGFKGFPGVSESQWSTDSGENWTSEKINVADAKPGDVVFMVGHGYASPGHVGIVTDGSGAGATIMEYYQSGQPAAGNRKLGQISDLVGIKRFYLVVKDARGGKQAPKTSPAAAAAAANATFLKQLNAASQAAAAATASKAGLKKPTLTGIQGRIQAELAAVPHELDPVERQAIAHIKALQASLHVGMSQAELAKDKVELAKWGKVLKDEIRKNAKEASADAREAAAAIRKNAREWAAAAAKAAAEAKAASAKVWAANTSEISRFVTDQWNVQMRDFDRATQRTLAAMATKSARKLKDMQTAFSLQMRDFDKATSAQLAAIDLGGAALTPAEQQLKDIADAEQQKGLQDALTQALATGDTVGEAAARKAILVDELTKQAAVERKARDEQTQTAKDAYQQQRDDLKTSLQDQQTDKEQALADQLTADQQYYQDTRDAQKTALGYLHDDQVEALNADLLDWNTWIGDKSKSWADFLTWLQQNPVTKGLAGGDLTPFDPLTTARNASLRAIAASASAGGDYLIAAALRAQVTQHAAGGIHVRPTLGMFGDQGPEATLPLAGQRGQAVVDQLARAITRATGGGAGTTIYGTFLGATERQVGRALEGLVTPQQSRVVRYNAPL